MALRLNPLYLLSTRLDLNSRRARRLVLAAVSNLDPYAIGQDLATTAATYEEDPEAAGADLASGRFRSLTDVLIEHYMDAQIDAIDAAGEYLSSLVYPSPVLPPADPFLGQVGSSTVRAFVEKTPAGVVARIKSGLPPEDALQASADYLAESIASEPHRLGRDLIATVANNDDRFSAYARVARSDACDWCKMLAGRGAVYTSKTATVTVDGQPYHQPQPRLRSDGSVYMAGGTCRCRMVAVPRDSGWTPPAEYDPPKRGTYATVGGTYRAGARTPERAASVQRQLEVLRRQVASGRGTGWTASRIAALEEEGDRLAGIVFPGRAIYLGLARRYDPKQPRDETGKWTSGGGAGGGSGDPWADALTPVEAADDMFPPLAAEPGKMYELGEKDILEKQRARELKAKVAEDLGERMADIPSQEMLDCYEAVNNGQPGYTDGTDGNGLLAAVREIREGEAYGDSMLLGMDPDGGFTAYSESEGRPEGWTFAKPGTPEYDRMVHTGVASGLVGTWAQTSNDSHAGALAIQEAVRQEFGLQRAARWPSAGTGADPSFILSQHGSTLQRFARATYDATQADLAARGITEITVHRGTGAVSNFLSQTQIDEAARIGALDRSNSPPVHVAPTTGHYLRPVSSWSADRSTAESFAETQANHGAVDMVGAVVQTTVPASQVFSTPYSGVGCLSEQEVVLLGRETTIQPTQVWVSDPYSGDTYTVEVAP